MNSKVKTIALSKMDKHIISEFFQKQWGSSEMVISSGTFHCDELDGFAVLNDVNEIVGLVTYAFYQNVCEIISLDSILENKGIGTLLLNEVEKHANCKGILQIKVITTNDNIYALSFYQKRGYLLTELLPNEVAKAREIKPEIPLIADNGIPIRDEIVMSKLI